MLRALGRAWERVFTTATSVNQNHQRQPPDDYSITNLMCLGEKLRCLWTRNEINQKYLGGDRKYIQFLFCDSKEQTGKIIINLSNEAFKIRLSLIIIQYALTTIIYSSKVIYRSRTYLLPTLILLPLVSITSLESTKVPSYSHNVEVVDYSAYRLKTIKYLTMFISSKITLPNNATCCLFIFAI